MAYASGAGNRVSRKNISEHVELSHDATDDLMAVFAVQSKFGIQLWGAIDGLCRKRDWARIADVKPAMLFIKPNAEDVPAVEVRRVPRLSKEAKRERAIQELAAAKRR